MSQVLQQKKKREYQTEWNRGEKFDQLKIGRRAIEGVKHPSVTSAREKKKKGSLKFAKQVKTQNKWDKIQVRLQSAPPHTKQQQQQQHKKRRVTWKRKLEKDQTK